jgi:hypothetical protein
LIFQETEIKSIKGIETVDYRIKEVTGTYFMASSIVLDLIKKHKLIVATPPMDSVKYSPE